MNASSKRFKIRCSSGSPSENSIHWSYCSNIKIEITNIEKEALAQVFSCELDKVFKNSFFNRTHPGDCFCNALSFTFYQIIHKNKFFMLRFSYIFYLKKPNHLQNFLISEKERLSPINNLFVVWNLVMILYTKKTEPSFS